MDVKTNLIALVAAVIVFAARVLIAKADHNGDIYIRTPRQIFAEVKSGYCKAKKYFSKERKNKGEETNGKFGNGNARRLYRR